MALAKVFSKKKDLLHMQNVMENVYGTRDGMEALAYLANKAHILEPIPVGDPIKSAFFEGQRHLVLSLLKFLKKDLSYLQQLIEEEQNND